MFFRTNELLVCYVRQFPAVVVVHIRGERSNRDMRTGPHQVPRAANGKRSF